jgi:hypothetical protein
MRRWRMRMLILWTPRRRRSAREAAREGKGKGRGSKERRTAANTELRAARAHLSLLHHALCAFRTRSVRRIS